ncbi:hypothetical protein OC835_000342 [Tilletia horrida]|nr:hypothetical protein OC835_000342 [Tilletia horrida]
MSALDAGQPRVRAKRKRLVHRKNGTLSSSTSTSTATTSTTATGGTAATTTTTTRAAAAAMARSRRTAGKAGSAPAAAAAAGPVARLRKSRHNHKASAALSFSPMRTRASALAHHHHPVHSSPALARRSRGDILKPSPKARKLDHHAPPSSAEWSTGSSEQGAGSSSGSGDSDSSFAPSPHMSPLRRHQRQYATRKTRLRAGPLAMPPAGRRKRGVLDEEEEEEQEDEDEEEEDTDDDGAEGAEEKGPEEAEGGSQLSDVEMSTTSAAQSEDEDDANAHDKEEEDEGDEDDESSDGPTDTFLLRKASDKQLHRLLKADLIRVHLMTGIWDDEQSMDPDLYTKDELVGGIMHWRKHLDTKRTDDASANGDKEYSDSENQEDADTPKASSSSRAKAARQYRKPKKQPSSSFEGDTTLLSRTDSSVIHSYKPPTPQLAVDDAENRPAEAFDELNGLDLEGLNLTDKEIHPSKLEKLEKIGSGGFKDVYVGKYHISKTRINKVAIADIRDQLTEMDIKELSLLRDLKHENIVRFIGVSIPEEPKAVPVMIVSELCSNGDLFDYIRNTPPPADDEVFRILLETARGLAYLHTRKPAIIHRDVKSTNVLITRNRTAKINDFGLARVKNSTRSVVRSIVGTVNWQAAELWVPKPHYNEKVDVWSAAMTFWEALQWHQPEKKYPFQGMNEHQIYLDVGQKRKRPSTTFIRRQYGDEIVNLLERMWHQTPRDRPTMTEVCEELELLIAQKRSVSGKRTR